MAQHFTNHVVFPELLSGEAKPDRGHGHCLFDAASERVLIDKHARPVLRREYGVAGSDLRCDLVESVPIGTLTRPSGPPFLVFDILLAFRVKVWVSGS